jgi:hypothetical protein
MAKASKERAYRGASSSPHLKTYDQDSRDGEKCEARQND